MFEQLVRLFPVWFEICSVLIGGTDHYSSVAFQLSLVTFFSHIISSFRSNNKDC